MTKLTNFKIVNFEPEHAGKLNFYIIKPNLPSIEEIEAEFANNFKE